MAKKISNEEQTRIRLLRKLADPKDADNPRWVGRWLKNFERWTVRKEKARDHKRRQRKRLDH